MCCIAVVGCALVVLPGCGGEGPDLPGALQRAIANGKPESGYPAVGTVSNIYELCSGTLVGVKTVVTAAHCILPGGTYDFGAAGKQWWGLTARRHPGYDETTYVNDVAVVLLAKQPPVRPLSISSRPPKKGQQLTLVGFGLTSADSYDSDVKRSGKNTVYDLTSTHIVIAGNSGDQANVCSGDSGGPSFATIDGNEVQVGIHSTGVGCFKAWDIRVDRHVDWIRKEAKGDVAVDGTPSPLTDLVPPKVKIASPAGGGRVKGTLEVSVEASDDEQLHKVTLAVDGKLQARELKEAPFSWSVATKPGQHTLVATAYDQTTNHSSDTVQVTAEPAAAWGEACLADSECESELCTEQQGRSFCSKRCQRDGECPERSSCVWDGEQFACSQPQEEAAGGCALAGGPGEGPPCWILVALLALSLVGRARPSSPRR